MTEIHIFLFSFFPLNRSDKEWQLCTTEGPTPVFKRFGGREMSLMAEIYFFCFPIFGISVYTNTKIHILAYFGQIRR